MPHNPNLIIQAPYSKACKDWGSKASIQKGHGNDNQSKKAGTIRILLIKILQYFKDPKLWALLYIPYDG